MRNPAVPLMRIVVAALVVAAVTGQLRTSLGYWHDAGIDDVTSNLVSFFSFFTIDSNVASALLLAVGGAVGLAGRELPRWYDPARACVTTYMAVTGVVYNLLLRGIELPQGTTLAWSNEVLHVVAPVYLVADWLLVRSRPLSRRTIAATLVFPVAWVAYTLVRGPHVTDRVLGRDHWYPYPFLNPSTSTGGYWSVAAYVVVIAAVVTAVAYVVVGRSRTGISRGQSPRNVPTNTGETERS